MTTNTMMWSRKSKETTTTMMPKQASVLAQTNKMKILLVVCFWSTMILIIGPQRYLSEIKNYENSITSLAYSYSTIGGTTRSLSSSSLATNTSSWQLLQLQSQSQNHHTKQSTKLDNPNTAIIISSSWIPTHPSTDMIDTVLKSVRNKLIGLDSETTPIFITVDALPSPDDSKIEMIDMYITNLYSSYLLDPQIHLIINQEHHHIGGSVWKVLQQIKYHYSGSIKYLYYVQHDFEFIHQIDHQALIETMNSNNNNVHHQEDNNTDIDAGVNYILFEWSNKRKRPRCSSFCDGRSRIDIFPSSSTSSSSASASTTPSPLLSLPSNNYNSSNNTSPIDALAHLCRSCKYSDNNHLVKFDWYYKYIGGLGWDKRPPEDTMQINAKNSCNKLGLYIYKSNMYALRHLDGRGTVIKPR
jgi:hypothetical protein